MNWRVILRLTDRDNNLHDYWYIRVPKARCPEPDFHFFQQVGWAGKDDWGNYYYDIGDIVGIQYTAEGNKIGQWSYLMHYLNYDYNPSLNGLDDGYFEPDSRLVADDTIL